jgi:hypothetical protein
MDKTNIQWGVSPFWLDIFYRDAENDQYAVLFVQMVTNAEDESLNTVHMGTSASHREALRGLLISDDVIAIPSHELTHAVLRQFGRWFHAASQVEGRGPELYTYCIDPVMITISSVYHTFQNRQMGMTQLHIAP